LSAIRATNPLQGPTREMYGQAPYIVNSFIMYNNSEIGLQTNLNFNISGDKLAIVVKGGTPDIYEKARPQADFNLQKRLGKRFNLNLSVSNIFNASYSKTYTYKDVDYLYSSYKLGQSFTLGLKYDLN
jgi:outer membrane receptor protein involved in Fe transport